MKIAKKIAPAQPSRTKAGSSSHLASGKYLSFFRELKVPEITVR